MDMVLSRNSITDSLAETSLSSAMRAATTVSMEHAVPELRITPAVRYDYFSLSNENLRYLDGREI